MELLNQEKMGMPLDIKIKFNCFKKVFCTALIFHFLNVHSQSIKVKVIDSQTFDSIPFSTIYFSSSKGIISDKSGVFELVLKEQISEDSIFVSSMGYEKVAYLLSDFNDSIIYLKPKPIELNNVIVNNKILKTPEILKKVVENFSNNYTESPKKSKIFFSRKITAKIDEFGLEKFKSSIDEINEVFIDSIINFLPKESTTEVETLCYYFENKNDSIKQKINLLKARETFQKENELVKSLNDRLANALRTNLKTDSYFKVRSGIFGGDLEVDGLEQIDSTSKESLEKFQKKELENKKNFAQRQKHSIKSFNEITEFYFNDNSVIDFFRKPKKYDFSDPSTDYLGDEMVYIINCKPKGRNKYSAKIFINADDFAVLRIDYKNERPLFKLKLLGVFINQYLSEGKILYSKFNNNKYQLSYLKASFGQLTGFDRPLKIIEKNKNVKGRKKQNQISFKLDFSFDQNIISEIMVFDSSTITNYDYSTLKENNQILPKFVEKFETNFWDEP